MGYGMKLISKDFSVACMDAYTLECGSIKIDLGGGGIEATFMLLNFIPGSNAPGILGGEFPNMDLALHSTPGISKMLLEMMSSLVTIVSLPSSITTEY